MTETLGSKEETLLCNVISEETLYSKEKISFFIEELSEEVSVFIEVILEDI